MQYFAHFSLFCALRDAALGEYIAVFASSLNINAEDSLQIISVIIRIL